MFDLIPQFAEGAAPRRWHRQMTGRSADIEEFLDYPETDIYDLFP